MRYIEVRRLRTANSIQFVPLPWVGGTGEKAFRAYTGEIDQLSLDDLK
jgi:hypothetical protein